MKPYEMICVTKHGNPLEYYKLRGRQNFVKVICVLPDESDVASFKTSLRTNKFEFEHNNHLMSSDICEKWLIAKFFTYNSFVKGDYSLKNFSSYDLIWLVENDIVSLKKRLSKCAGRLPHDIPKLAILQNNEIEASKSFVARNYGISVFIALYRSALNDIDKDKRRDIMAASFDMLRNPETGLTEEFAALYESKQGPGFYLGVGLLVVFCAGLGYYLYRGGQQKEK